MDRAKGVGEDLFTLVKVMQSSATVLSTSEAIAPLLDGARILFMTGIFHIEAAPITEKEARIAGVARGNHAIEEVDATVNCDDKFFQSADTHQVSGTIEGKHRGTQADR